ncbi:hypothetical protein N9T83_01615 [Candidatus Pelagibacter sp.]|jgi:hypothetical protein|nr:hypothetical protein [Candidatus Pelagibacter sp.]MDA9681212.1 hypothetical protein [Candidatus Pelagibacter sp.]
MKKKLLILFLILACSTNAYSNEIIYQNCVHGKDGIQMENKKNKEGVKMYDKFLMKINIAKAEVIQEIYVTKEHLDSVKKQNPDFVIPKIPMIRTSKIIFVDEDKIKYLDVTLEYTIYLKDKEIRVDVMEPNYWLKCE